MESELKHNEGEDYKVKEAIEHQETTEKQGREKGELTFDHESVQVKIPYETKHFEYSEKIQKDTGILGYERKIISWEDLINVVPKFSSIQNNKNSRLERSEKFFLEEMLSAFSDGEYPKNTLNHEIAGYANGFESNYGQQLLNDRFLLQEIFGLSTLQKGSKKGLEFQHNAYEGGEPPTNFFVYKKRGDSMVGSGENREGLEPLDLVRSLNEESYAMTRTMGLNFESKNIYRRSKNNTSFGFSPKSPLFRNYLEKSLKLLCKQNETEFHQSGTYGYDGSDLVFPIGEVLAILLSSNNYPYKRDYANPEEEAQTKDLMKNDIIKIFEKLGIDVHKSFDEDRMDYLFDEVYNCFNMRDTHIPIVIGNDKIQQLRWGDADYAHTFTSKGLNYIKINHSDTLINNEQE